MRSLGVLVGRAIPSMIRTAGYQRIVVASGLANLGDGIRQVALPLLVASITQDALLVAGMTAFAYLPWVLLSLPIGAWVDRNRPEVFLIAAGVTRAGLLAILAVALLTDVRSVALLYAVAFLLGVGEAAYDNASQSLMPRVVPDALLEKANGSLVGAERLGQDLIGPAVGGVIFAVSAALPFGLSALALFVAVALIVPIRTARPVIADRSTPGVLVREAAAGLRWLWQSQLIRTIILAGAGLTFFTQTWEPILVLLAGSSAAGFGLVLAIGAVGGIVGALATPGLTRRFDHRLLQISALGLAAAVDLALAAVPRPAMAAMTLAAVSFSFAVWNVLSITMRQRLVPAEFLGRVNAASRTLSMTAALTGTLSGGAIAAWLGLSAPLWVSGAALVLLALRFAQLTRSGA